MINLSLHSDLISEDSVSNYINSMKIEVRAFGAWRRNPTKLIKEVVVSEFQITYIKKGKVRIKSPTDDYICQENMLFVFVPFVTYSVEKICEYDMDMYNVFFELYPVYRHQEFIENLFGGESAFLDIDSFNGIISMFEDLNNQSLENLIGKKLLVESLLNYILVAMISKQKLDVGSVTKDYHPINGSANIVVRKAIKIVNENMSEPINLEKLCRELSVSKSYLYKCFYSVVHTSPQKFFLQTKVSRAKNMLKYDRKTISECATELGFSSPYHLSASFKKHFGMSPTKYLSEEI